MVAEDEIKFKVFFNFANAVHDGGVVFDTNLGSDLISTEWGFLAENIHSHLASGFNVGNTGFATHLFNCEIIVLCNFFDNLFGGGRAEFGGAVDADGTVFDKL